MRISDYKTSGVFIFAATVEISLNLTASERLSWEYFSMAQSTIRVLEKGEALYFLNSLATNNR
jgi:hypothetical protein